MNHPVIPIAVHRAEVNAPVTKERKRQAPKGRRVDPAALADVQQLLGDEPRRADLLIEHLHRIQDHFGHLPSSHLAALAQEMRLAQTEVYEVASFYHHFDVVKEGQEPPASLAVRVCDGLACEMAGAKELLAKLPALLGREIRVIAAPCIGRCEQAPAAVVGQHPVPHATCEAIVEKAQAGTIHHIPEVYTGLAEYEAGGGYSLLKDCIGGSRDVESVIKVMEDSGLRGLGGAGFPAGRKWRIVR
ncbi:MAG: NAD(P)H-dependent oxidoreductase subunit E, partial [Ramlibacter sp.]|nr:NAD(P)H-dependent oxidoreductase subunit E [Ramlibacter sp.]